MTKSLRISIADDEADMREFFVRMLPRCGHEVVSAASSGLELMKHFRDFRPDLVISDVKMPELDGIEASQQIYRERAIPIILVSAHDVSFDSFDFVFAVAHLVKPISFSMLQPTINYALLSFQVIQRLEAECPSAEQAVADRKFVMEAKRILMKHEDLGEIEAFVRLQTLATETSKKLVDLAQIIIASQFPPSLPGE